MTDTATTFDLSPEENAYFESCGTTEITATPAATPEPVVETPAATPEPVVETPAAVEPVVEKMVSLSALHEERARRKTTDAEKRTLETQLAELRGKFSIVEKLNTPAAPVVPEPTIEEDIFAVVKKQGESIAQFEAREKAATEARAADTARNEVVTAYQADARQFEATTPDFKAAYNHLLQSRANELAAMGYSDPVQLHQAITNDEMAIANMAKANGKSAAEIIYSLAKMRGYAKPADPKPEPAPAPAAKTTPTAAEKIETINAGQSANKSLSNTGGSAGDPDMTGEMLLKMPMDEFEAWTSKNPAKAKRLMGG
jgi:hypothetical protein